MHKASVAIFTKKSEQKINSPTPFVSPDLFRTAIRVIQNKNTEELRTMDGYYLVSYSETGPFSERISDDWLPVKIVVLQKWNSGGIKKNEMEDFLKYESSTPTSN